MASTEPLRAEDPDQVGVLQNRLRLAHQARRAKEHQLDDIRRALCDIGFMEDDDPYSHADLADVIRQNGQALTDGGAAEEADAATVRQYERSAWDATQHVLELKATIERVRTLATRLEEFSENALREDDRKLYAALARDVRARCEPIQETAAPVREQKERPTHPDGTPYSYVEMTAEGWGFCDGCRMWSTATTRRPHQCPETHIGGPAAGDA